ncbi:MAG TPA: hypothetical protein VFQ61_31835 [Polyangiaceae bacterium]|nr:hypothetical protein [Polyangiaceae bacterium]
MRLVGTERPRQRVRLALDPDGDILFPTDAEQAEEQRQRADAERQRAEAALARVAELEALLSRH